LLLWWLHCLIGAFSFLLIKYIFRHRPRTDRILKTVIYWSPMNKTTFQFEFVYLLLLRRVLSWISFKWYIVFQLNSFCSYSWIVLLGFLWLNWFWFKLITIFWSFIKFIVQYRIWVLQLLCRFRRFLILNSNWWNINFSPLWLLNILLILEISTFS